MNRVVAVASAVVAAMLSLAAPAAEEQTGPGQGQIVTYDEALARVIQNSHELKLADEDVRDARRRLKRARRQYHPRLKVQGTFRGDVLEADQWSSDRNMGAGMVLDWSPFRNGELLRENASSRVGVMIATLSRRQAAIDLEYEFRQLCHGILMTADEVELKKLQRDLEERRLAQIERELEIGKGTKANVLDQKGAFFDADAAWRKSRQALQIALIELEERMGHDEVAGVADVDRTIGPIDELTVEDCLAAAQDARIALLTVRQQVRLADLGVKYAGLKRLPSVYFFTGSDYALTQEVGGDEIALLAGVTVSYPIYGAGDTAAAIADAKAAAVRVRIQSSQTHLRVEREVREAYWAYVNTLRQLESTREREEVFEDDFEEARVLRERGALGDIAFAEAEIRYRESRRRLRTLELDALMARATLVKVIGVSSLDEVAHGPARSSPEPLGKKEAQ